MDESLGAQNSDTNPHMFLQTAVAKIDGQTYRLLIDSGSQRIYISSRTAKRLNLVPDKEDFLMVYTFGAAKPKEISSPSVEVSLTTKRNVTRKIRVNIVPHITNRIPIADFVIPDEIDLLADDSSVGEGVDILIGNDCYFSFMRPEHFKLRDHLYLVNSDFGWLITGNAYERDNSQTLSVVTYCQCHESGCPYFTEPDLPLRNIDMKFLWTLESIGIVDSPKTSHQEEAVKFFITKLNGHGYKFPPDLPTIFGVAFGRLKCLLKRSDLPTIREYDDIL